MASTEDATAANNHNLAIQQREHQQELIKLLAQHFHHQLYILSNQNPSQMQSSSPTIQTLPPAPPLLNQYQASRAHPTYPLLDPNLLSSTADISPGVDHSSNGLNLAAAMATNNNHRLLQNHRRALHTVPLAINSDQTDSPNVSPIANSSSSAMPESNQLVDALAAASRIHPDLLRLYPTPDMNLINALGLNLANNQFVLSLHHQQQQQQQQQQALFQTAASVRQYHLSEDFSQQQQYRTDRRPTGLNQHSHDGKEVLKFGINAILGGGSRSPDSGTKLARMKPSGQANSHLILGNQEGEIHGLSARDISERQIDVAVDCDSMESMSDSGSIKATTPASKQIHAGLFDHSRVQLDHQSAMDTQTVNSSCSNERAQNNRTVNLQQVSTIHHPPQSHTSSHPLPFLTASPGFPWAVAARGKPRRGMMRRAVFSDSQRVGLEKRFQLQKYISKPDRKKLAEKLGLRDSQVKIWFQNRRMKWRNSKERELLSAGGSREQTLPTRNNPNPDLSDVGETIKRLATSNSGSTSASSSVTGNESTNSGNNSAECSANK